MNTQPQDPQYIRAMELALQGRREELSAEDQAFLDGYLAANPAAVQELRETDALLQRLSAARVTPDQEFTGRLRGAVGAWIREDALSQGASQEEVATGLLGRCWGWLFGRDEVPESVSGSTLVLGRSLAFYLGAAVVVCVLRLTWDSPPEPAEWSRDRAHELMDPDKPESIERRRPADLHRGSRPR